MGGTRLGGWLTKSELIKAISGADSQFSSDDTELAVNTILKQFINALIAGERIEIRGFGSFYLMYQPPRNGRNPKTGKRMTISEKYRVHFKPGASLRSLVNDRAG